MKHTMPVTVLLVLLFLVAQGIGLFILNQYINVEASDVAGKPVYDDPPFGLERPPLEEATSFIFILVSVGIGTALIFLLMRFRAVRIWKFWFFMSVAICLTVAFGAFFSDWVALGLAIILAMWKVIRPNIYIHNLTELFIYAGLAAIFVPVMNLFAAMMLLVFISIYDAYAVWKSKHMVSLANFQSETKLFAGLSLSYNKKGIVQKSDKVPALGEKGSSGVRSAILGGGDIGFPLIFAGVVMKSVGWVALIIPVFAALALGYLLLKSEKGKFYPAMPFISVGCFIGYVMVFLIMRLF